MYSIVCIRTSLLVPSVRESGMPVPCPPQSSAPASWELVEVMKDQMQDSKRVKLDGFGSFKIGIESKGAATAAKFAVAEHIKGLHVVFMPERTKDTAGNRSKQFLQGAKVEELPLNTVVKEEPEP